ncbi:hypothetical protein CK556_03500 [Mesoplasma chauliocola]|uniref:HTH rpiR-type domain-containing protein n=1 Tax=Mesoplasma chauliocola TaxID=216427 RepID=A0A249SPJ2_9MOLU|nr:hypothetical protein [Mesoplasma chauliocola]ASZ09391.1 hypothetical protein CK556_03500 [Mesoplasma chauliocola]
MESIYKKVEQLQKDYSNSSYKLIAKAIWASIKTGDFKKQKDLAVECFTSESSITKFAQYLGFSGYREMIFFFKQDYNSFHNLNEKFKRTNLFDSIINWINLNEKFIETLSREIKKSKRINIYHSYQLELSSRFLYETLITLGYNVILVNHNINFISGKLNKQIDQLNIAFVSGHDSDFLIDCLNSLNKNNDQQNVKNFLFISERQKSKVTYKLDGIIELNFEFNNSHFVQRNVAVEMFILELYKKLL